MKNITSHPSISPHLLWEYDLNNFDYQKSGFVVIERVIERGNLKDWIEIFHFYGEEKIIDVARNSRQLSVKDKNFTEVFVKSQFLQVA